MVTGRICDRLSRHYGEENVFIDIDSIPVGVDFHDHLDSTLSDSDILIAVIGPRWVGPRRGKAPRIMDDEDFVRLELETALQRKIAIVPLLVEGASLPPKSKLPASLQPLLRRQSLELDSGADFHSHVSKLIASIDRLLGRASVAATPPRAEPVREEPSAPPPDPIATEAAATPPPRAAAVGAQPVASPPEPAIGPAAPEKRSLRTAITVFVVLGVLVMLLFALVPPQSSDYYPEEEAAVAVDSCEAYPEACAVAEEAYPADATSDAAADAPYPGDAYASDEGYAAEETFDAATDPKAEYAADEAAGY